MRNFTVSQLIKCLMLPLGTFVYGVAVFGEVILYGEVRFTGYAAVRFFYFPLALILLGGVLPVLLTIFRDIHTERYFFKQLCVYVVCYAAIWFVGQMSFGILSTIYHIGIAAGKVVFELLKVQDEETTRGERAVMFLSDFFIWYCIDYCLMAFQR